MVAKNVVDLYFERMTSQVRLEKPYLAIQMDNGKSFGIKSTDYQIIGIMMAYYQTIEKRTIDNAFEISYSNFVMNLSGNDKEKIDAGEESLKCHLWLRNYLSIYYLESDELVNKCRQFSQYKIENYEVLSLPDSSRKSASNERPDMFNSLNEIFSNLRNEALKESDIVIIDLETRRAGMKPSNLIIISTVLAFCLKYTGMSLEDAIQYAICTFVLTRDGTEKEKTDAKETIDNACSWDWDFYRINGRDEASKLKYECNEILKNHFGIME